MSTALAPLIDRSSTLCAVPLYADREKMRGYNQSDLLAEHLSKSWQIDLLPRGTLTRSRDTAAQVGKKYAERQLNVCGAFSALPEAVAGRAILLVDDVCTTGATLNACAEALLHAGAITVKAVTLARAV
jgi:ComF family protein